MSLSDDNESSMSNLENENKNDDDSNESKVDLNTNSDQSIEYNFGWNKYSEITNGRFAMIGFVAIILIELISNQSFLTWAGILD